MNSQGLVNSINPRDNAKSVVELKLTIIQWIWNESTILLETVMRKTRNC